MLIEVVMRQMYIDCWSETVDASHSKYVFSDRVPVGYVLIVLNCYAHSPDGSVADIVSLGVRSGGKDCYLRSRGKDLAKEGMSTLSTFLVGEGDKVFAYFPNADNTNTVALHINGYLVPVKEWREGGGL